MRYAKPEKTRSAAPERNRNHQDAQARNRFTPRPASGLVLTARDDDLLADLLLLRVMSRSQIQRRFFGSTPRCNARLRQLFDWGLVSRAFAPTAPFGSEGLYAIGQAAASRIPGIASRLGIELDAEDMRVQTRRPAMSLVEHALLIGDIYICVREEAMKRSDINLELWLPERLMRHEYEIRRTDGQGTAKWRTEVFAPDAFFRLRDTSGGSCSLLLEADCGNTNARQFAGKMRISSRFQASALAQDTLGSSSAITLVVTTSGDRRLSHLCRIAEVEGTRRWLFATMADVMTEGFLAEIWHAPGSPFPVSLSDEFMNEQGRTD